MGKRIEKLEVRVARFRRLRWPQRLRQMKIWSRHPFAVPFFTVLFLLTVTGGGYLVVRQQTHQPADEPYVVIISHDGNEEIVPSRQPTVGTLLKKLNIHLNQGDVVEPGLQTGINQDRFRINIYRAVPVAIVDQGRQSYTFSAATTPRSIAEQVGTKPYPEDRITAEPVDSFLAERAIGKRVVITRATPVNMNLYGTPLAIRTHARTVGELLKQKNITLAQDDQVLPAAGTPITPDQAIFIIRSGTKLETVTEVVPKPIETVNDPTLSSGTSAVRQRGAAGQKVVTYQVNLQNGREVSRTAIQEVVTVPPVTEIVARGTAPLTGSLATWLYKLRQCESHGNYQINTGNGYYGAYQFSASTWNRIAQRVRPDLVGTLPSAASPADQDFMIVTNTKLSSGGLATQNPGCYRSQGLSAFPPPG